MPFGGKRNRCATQRATAVQKRDRAAGPGNGFSRAGCAVRLNGGCQSDAGTHGDGGRVGCQSSRGVCLPSSQARKHIQHQQQGRKRKQMPHGPSPSPTKMGLAMSKIFGDEDLRSI
jgi:hypothetical protein